MSHQPKSFSLRCIRGVDQGMCPSDCIDEFEILADGQPAFRVIYDYGLDGDQVMTIKELLVGYTISDLPFISNGFQLGAKLMQFLDQLLGEQDMEFYADCFHDEEGESVMYSVTELMLG